MNQQMHNYRPESRVPIRPPRFPMWRSLLLGAIVFAAYPLTDYVMRQGDIKALKAENAAMKERIKRHSDCMNATYLYPRVPSAPTPRKEK